jgi:hypothetical protein
MNLKIIDLNVFFIFRSPNNDIINANIATSNNCIHNDSSNKTINNCIDDTFDDLSCAIYEAW